MTRDLTPAEKELIEREFAAKQQAAYRRRRFARWIFVVGVTAGVLSGLLRGFGWHGITEYSLRVAWVLCLLSYVGSRVLPTSLNKDLDPGWHLNPWQEALSNLSEGRTIGEAIALLTVPPLIQMLASFLYFASK